VTLRRFQVRYANIPGQAEPVQPLDVLYSGVYAQDEWRPTSNLTLTAGVRVDAPNFDNTAYDNPVADTMTFRDQNGNPIHYNSGALPGVNLLFSPRVGFNLNVGGKQQTHSRRQGLYRAPAYVGSRTRSGTLACSPVSSRRTVRLHTRSTPIPITTSRPRRVLRRASSWR
jgi:hypothetical protein